MSNYHELFVYNPETGQLVWKERPRHHFSSDKAWKVFNTAMAGRVAGHKQVRANGDRQSINVRTFSGCGIKRAHRVIWEMMTGQSLPKNVLIDHIDGDPWNNKWSNLRLAMPHQNQFNAKRRRDNKSGIKGVSYVHRDKRWAAQIRVAGKRISLGHHITKGLAAVARAKAALRYHGQFARI